MKNKTIRSLVLESLDDINSFDGLLEASEWRRYMSNEDIFRINEAYRQFTFLEPLLARDGVSRGELWEQFLLEKSLISVAADKFKKMFGMKPDPADKRWEDFKNAELQKNTARIENEKAAEKEKQEQGSASPSPGDILKQKLADERQTFTKIAEAFFKSQGLPPDDKTGLSLMLAALLVLYRNDGAILDVNALNAIKKKKIPIPFYDGSPQDHPTWADALKRMKRQSNDFPLFRKKVLQKNMSQIQSMEDMLEELLIFLKSKDLLIDPTKLKVPKKPTNKPWEKSKSDANADVAASEIEATEIVSKAIANDKPKWAIKFVEEFVNSRFSDKNDTFKKFVSGLVTDITDYLSNEKALFESRIYPVLFENTADPKPPGRVKSSWNKEIGPVESHREFSGAKVTARNFIKSLQNKTLDPEITSWIKDPENITELIKSVFFALAEKTLLAERKRLRSKINLV